MATVVAGKTSGESFWSSFWGLLILGVLAAAVVAVGGWAIKRWVWPALAAQRAKRRNVQQLTDRVGQLTESVEELSSYLTHVRDFVMPMIWRALEDYANVHEHIRRDILEPIRAYVPTQPGEHLKVVWFRPNSSRTALIMHEQVGHRPEGQQAAELPIGSGAAGRAFTGGETVYEADIASSDLFHPLPHGAEDGSLVCVPIRRGNDITGVLSVLSSSKDAFRLPEFLYFEALASAIGAIELLE